jgi:hypothetical protein
MRRGAPAAAAAAMLGATSDACDLRGSSEGIVGKARHAPSPRKKWRRLSDQ